MELLKQRLSNIEIWHRGNARPYQGVNTWTSEIRMHKITKLLELGAT